jgi:hypothetical protein
LQGLAHLAWDGLVGLPLLITAWLTIGFLRFDRPMIIVSSALFLGFALVRSRLDPVARFPLRGTTRPAWAAIGLLAFVALAGLTWNRVPVLFFDSLAYHFAQPELWLLERHIAPFEWSLHSWFPPGMSVLYGVGLALGGDAWANDANLMLGLALGLTTFDLARRCWDPRAGLVALIALFSVPQILFALTIPAADLAHGTFVAAALGALLLSHLHPDGAWQRRAAWIVGGALLTKYLGVLVPLALGGVFAALSVSRGMPFLRRGLAALRFCAIPFLLLLPWLLANVVAVGNPIAPILAAWLPVEGLASGGEAAFVRDARGGLPGLSDLRAATPRLFGGAHSGIYPGPAWGWPFAAWIAAAALAAWFDPRVRQALGVAATLFAVWFITFRWERFLIPTTFFVCLGFAGAVWLTAKHARVWRLLALALVIAGLAYTPLTLTSIARYSGGIDVVLGREAPETFLKRSLPQHRLLTGPDLAWNPAADRLLFLGEMRHYRTPVRRVAPTGFNVHPFALELKQSVTVEQVHHGLRRRGFSHLLVDLDWIDRSAREYPSLRSLRESPETLQAYLASLGTPLVSDGRRALYSLPEVK